MVRAFLLFLLCMAFLSSMAQKYKSTGAIYITKETAMKFAILNEVLGIPATYEVLSYETIYNLVDVGAKDREKRIFVSNKEVSFLFKGTVAGDKIIFTKILLKKNGRQIKLEDKVYIIK